MIVLLFGFNMVLCKMNQAIIITKSRTELPKFCDGRLLEKRYGIKPGMRVKTSIGYGYIIGISDNQVWFKLDKDDGISYWENLRNFTDNDIFDFLGSVHNLEDILPPSYKTFNFNLDKHVSDRYDDEFFLDITAYHNKEFYYLYCEIQNGDIEILVEDDKWRFRAHKDVLTCTSKFFKKMFSHNMKENNESTVKLSHISKEMFGKILLFMYCYKTSTTDIVNMLEIANFLEMELLINECINVIARNITFLNVFIVLGIADELKNNFLKNKCVSFINNNIYTLFFMKQSLSDIKNIITVKNELKLGNLDLIKLIIYWTRDDIIQQIDEVIEIIKSIVYKTYLTDDEIEEITSFISDDLINTPEIKKLIDSLKPTKTDQ